MSASRTRTSAIVRSLDARSLGIGPLVVRLRAALREAAGVEEREIHRRRAVHDPVRDVSPGGGRVLEAVAAEAHGEEEALHAGRPADDGVVVVPLRRSPARSIAVTRTPWAIVTPRWRARFAKPLVTSAGPARPSPGPHAAAIRSSTRSAGTSFLASAGAITRTSTPSRRCRAIRGSKPRRSSGSETRKR